MKLDQSDFIRLLVLVVVPFASLLLMPVGLPQAGPLIWVGAAVIWVPLAAISCWFQAYPLLVLWTLMTQRRWVDSDLDDRIAASFNLPGNADPRPGAD